MLVRLMNAMACVRSKFLFCFVLIILSIESCIDLTMPVVCSVWYSDCKIEG